MRFKLPHNTALVMSAMLYLFSCTNSPVANAQDELSPEQLVINLHDKLLFIMENAEDLGYQGRYEELEGLIPRSFNLPVIAQVLLGRHWRELDDDGRQEFINLYERLVIATYASRFDNYDGEEFLTKGIEDLNRGRKLVKTELHPNNGDTVTLDYLMDNRNDRWWIISVIANGVNDISLKRAEYADVIQMRDYDALLEEIQNKIKEMENSS